MHQGNHSTLMIKKPYPPPDGKIHLSDTNFTYILVLRDSSPPAESSALQFHPILYPYFWASVSIHPAQELHNPRPAITPQLANNKHSERPTMSAAAVPAKAGRLVTLFKQGWNEIPEVVGSSFMAVLGFGMAGFGLWNYYRKDGDNRRYKTGYVVMRSSDPRAAKVHKD